MKTIIFFLLCFTVFAASAQEAAKVPYNKPINKASDTVNATFFTASKKVQLKDTVILAKVLTGTSTMSVLVRDQATGNVDTVAQSTLGGGSSGTYTPTITTVTNCSGSSSGTGHWIRMGNQVTVDVPVAVTVTTGASQSEFYVSLPVASTISSGSDVTGQGQIQGAYTVGPGITGNTTNHVADVTYTQTASGSPNMFLHFTYTVD